MEKFDISYFGCVAKTNDIPNLFIMNDGKILDGIPLEENENNLYVNLENNEIVFVGVRIEDADNNEISANTLNEYNLELYQYLISPFQIHTLKTNGLTIDIIIELDLFYLLFVHVLWKYMSKRED